VMVQITLPTQQEWIRHARTYYDSFSSSTGEKVIAIIDNHGYVFAPVPVAPVHTADMVLLPEGLKALKKVAKEVGLDLRGAYLNLDGGVDSSPHCDTHCNRSGTQLGEMGRGKDD
jgi:hypothetical protein